MKLTHETIKEAVSIDHPVTFSVVLIRSISLFLWIGDLEAAEELLDRSIAYTETHSLAPYVVAGQGYKGVLAARRGDAKRGVERLRDPLAKLRSAGYEALTAVFSM